MQQETLTRITAKTMIAFFAGKKFHAGTLGMGDYQDAVQEVLDAAHKKDEQYLTSYAVNTLLDIYDKNKRRIFGAIDSLSLALNITCKHAIDRETAERVVQTAARAGFYGRFPDITIKLLERPPSPEEVTMLVSAYVANTGSSSTAAVETLTHLANACMSANDARIQCGRIEKFEREFREDDCY